MGYLSDIYEMNRDRGYDTAFPAGLSGNDGNQDTRLHGEKIREQNIQYENNVRTRRTITNSTAIQENMRMQKILVDSIRNELIELEQIKLRYILIEKHALYLLNQDNLQCIVVKDTLKLAIEQAMNTYRYISDIKSCVSKDITDNWTYSIRPVNEEMVKEELFDTVINALFYALSHGFVMDRILFKKMVKDLYTLMQSFVPEFVNAQKTEKKNVEKYFEKRYKLKLGMTVCDNCGKPLFTDFPYCFNCYDRKAD